MKPTDSAEMLKIFFLFLFNNILFKVLPPLSASFITASSTFFYPKPLPSDKISMPNSFQPKQLSLYLTIPHTQTHIIHAEFFIGPILTADLTQVSEKLKSKAEYVVTC